MPTYSYKCGACGHVADIVHGMSEIVTPVCVECGSSMSKKFGVAAVTFNGEGFYSKDKG